mgnify:CR=1 FL=1
MPSIIFTNFNGESKEIDLSKVSNAQALEEGFKHLDKALNNNKPTPNTKNANQKPNAIK